MKRIIALFLAVFMLAALVGCGGGTTSSPSTDTQDDAEVLTSLFRGIYELEERDPETGEPKTGTGAYAPLRFSQERLTRYEGLADIPYAKCTTGVRLDFYTSAEQVSFRFTMTDSFGDGRTGYPDDCFDIFEDDVYQESVVVSKHSEIRELNYRRKSTESESRITIVFPTLHGVILSDISLGEARPVDTYEHKILVFGDSITQGLYADKVSDNYIDTICRSLNADYMNLAVGGEVYRQSALDRDVHYEPTHIIIALGTNDFHRNHDTQQVAVDCNAYFQMISMYYPGIPVTVITPFEDQGENYVSTYTKAAQDHGCYVIDGRTLMPMTAENLFDTVHPNSQGFSVLAQNLLPIMRERLS